MAYKTLVASTANQQRWSYDSNAHTLAELKQEFTQQGIPYNGLSITEGLCTKAELTHDEAEIPVSQRTVNYNGETYSRVFLITNTRKNIASGSFPKERKDFAAFIRETGIGEAIQEAFGNNWTRVPTAKLLGFFEQLEQHNTPKIESNEEDKGSNASENSAPKMKEPSHPEIIESIYMLAKNMLRSNALYLDDVEVLAALLTELFQRKNEEQVNLTDNDIDNMLYNARFND